MTGWFCAVVGVTLADWFDWWKARHTRPLDPSGLFDHTRPFGWHEGEYQGYWAGAFHLRLPFIWQWRPVFRNYRLDEYGWCHPLLVRVACSKPGFGRALWRVEWVPHEGGS